MAWRSVGAESLTSLPATVVRMPTRFRILVLSLAVVACGTRPVTAKSSDTSRAVHDTSVQSAPEAAPAAEDSAIGEAQAVVRAYYAAINAHDYPRAYAAWGSGGPPRQPTLQTFASGFDHTDSVRVVLGAPGRIEGAAGSRYVTIPVRLQAFEKGTAPRVYAGSYTLRRTVVPGADAADQRWHLYSANLH